MQLGPISAWGQAARDDPQHLGQGLTALPICVVQKDSKGMYRKVICNAGPSAFRLCLSTVHHRLAQLDTYEKRSNVMIYLEDQHEGEEAA